MQFVSFRCGSEADIMVTKSSGKDPDRSFPQFLSLEKRQSTNFMLFRHVDLRITRL